MSLPANSEVPLTFLLSWAAKATVLLAAAWAMAFALRGRSAAVRHHAWTVAILGSLALPFLGWSLPEWHSGLLGRALNAWWPSSTATVDLQMSSFPTTIAAASSVPMRSSLSSVIVAHLPAIMLALWAFGAALILLRLLAGLLRLASVAARSRTLDDAKWTQTFMKLSASSGIRRRVRLLECSNPDAMPLTWGALRPRIVFPARSGEWSEERRRIVLTHELAHIRRNDWVLQICAELLRGLLWFHPLAWHAANRLRQESERACDDAVLNSGIEAPEYASQLLLLARTLSNSDRRLSVALAVARPNNLERRFAAMLNPSITRAPLSPKARVLAVLLGASLLLPLAALGLPAQTPLARGASPLPATAAVLRTSAVHDGATPPASSAPVKKSQAQANGTDNIAGIVRDQSGAVIGGATITLTNSETSAKQQTVSDSQGNFALVAVPVGAYELQVLDQGFRTYSAVITLEADRALSVGVTLTVGSLAQNVEVEADGIPSSGAPQSPAVSLALPECGSPPVQLKAPETDSRLRAGGQVTPPTQLASAHPIYPAALRRAGVEGNVYIDAVIGTGGTLLSPCLLNSAPSVNADLVPAVVDAITQWRYSPTLLNGEPVETETRIAVNFRLSGSQPPASTFALSGKITDRDHTADAVPNAQVTLTNLTGSSTRSIDTDDQGKYAFPAVRPGTYNLTISKIGFQSAAVPPQNFQVGRNYTINVPLDARP